jgi:hypothetical protein
MKINEIANRRLDEAPPGVNPTVKYVGPYFDKAAAKAFGVGKGTTQAELDALRAGETNAAKAGAAAADRAHSTVSSDELNALLHPTPSPEPTVASWLKRRGDPGFDPDLSKTQALPNYLQNMPPARIGPVTRPSTSGPHSRPATQRDLGTTEPELGLDTAASRDIGQIRPGAETSAAAPAAGSAEADVQRYTMDEYRRFQELLSTNPAAAAEQAKKMGWVKKGLTAAAIAAPFAGWYAGNKLYPDTIPSAGQLVDKAFTKAAAIGADPNGAGPPPGERKYDFRTNEPSNDSKSDSSNSKVTNTEKIPPASNNDDLKNDPEYQELLRKALAGEKMNESTAALNRMVYLSRL